MQTELRRRLDEYISKLPDSRIVEFPCPGCAAKIPIIKPEKDGIVWSSMMTCPDCEAIFFTEVDFTGTASMNMPTPS